MKDDYRPRSNVSEKVLADFGRRQLSVVVFGHDVPKDNAVEARASKLCSTPRRHLSVWGTEESDWTIHGVESQLYVLLIFCPRSSPQLEVVHGVATETEVVLKNELEDIGMLSDVVSDTEKCGFCTIAT